ncbi:sulfurtransferase complex subunit TusC [Piscirickettsia salmonis]|uniref:sulfurtransferase complex subunit TusC n=1 Tax=Piscirickettsia salmonis TaxID=1238 RepID=UPI000F085DDD|nr:sulfurtransferase complex subunit TusC [Piscirickettsiaceae bacterium NZ-RLO2]
MTSLAIILQSAPYGNHSAQSGLNATLAASVIIENLGVFFIANGILQLKSHQDTSTLQCKNQLAVYQLLELYEIENVYLDQNALQQYGLSTHELDYDYPYLNRTEIYQKIRSYSHILSF